MMTLVNWKSSRHIDKKMEPFCFKNWSNKKYAIFNSLHKVIRIGTLSFAYTLLQLQPLLAQNDTAAPLMFFELEEVESIAEIETEIYPANLRTISTILREQILTSPAPSLALLIDYQPLTDIRTRGYHDIQSDVIIQGGSFDQSLVLLNGINISDPQTGHFNLDLPLSHRQFEKLEILIGPATKTYGLNAYSGAINLITRPSDSIKTVAELRMGQYGYYHASATIHLPSGPVKSMLAISSSSSNGYRENTDFDQSGIYLHSNLNLKFFSADLMAGLNRKDFGANSFYSPRFPEQYEETDMQFAGLKLSTRKMNPSIESIFYWRRHTDHFLLFRNNPSYYQNHHKTDVLGAETNLIFSSVLGITKSGITIRSEQIVSSSLGTDLPSAEPVYNNDSVSYTFGDKRLLPGLFLNHTFQIGRIKSSGGILFQSSSFDEKFRLYPGLDLAYQISPVLSITGAVNKSMRLPTFTDLYYQGPQNVGNPLLRPEEATTFESGIFYNNFGISGHLSLFYRKGKETIDWIWLDDEKWHTQNITELNTMGGEFTVSIDPAALFNASKFIEHLRTSYSYTEISLSSDEYISNYALDNLRHKWLLDIGIELPWNFSLNSNTRLYSRNGTYLLYNAETGSSEELPYKNYILNDLSIRYTIKQISLSIDISNVMNVEYIDLGSFIQPGRWIIAGLRVNLI